MRIQAGIPGAGLLYLKDKITEPNSTIKEILMGFQPGTTAAPGLSEMDRCQILGQTSDINIITWLITQATLTTQATKQSLHTTLTQHSIIDHSLPLLPYYNNKTNTQPNLSPPQPTLWQPLYNPEE